jgi:hypothetical protein
VLHETIDVAAIPSFGLLRQNAIDRVGQFVVPQRPRSDDDDGKER